MPTFEVSIGGKTYEVDAPNEQAAAMAVGRMSGRPPAAPGPKPAAAPKPRSLAADVGGAITTFNRSIPGFDEAADGVQAIANLVGGKSASLGDAWKDARKASGNQAQSFRADRRNASNLTTGVGLALQSLIPSGAVSATPAIAGGRGLIGSVMRGLSGPTGQAAVAGGTMAAVDQLASEGNLGQRVQKANEAVPAGMATGALIPAGVSVVAGAANRVGQLLRPAAEQSTARAARVLQGRVPGIQDVEVKPGDLPFEAMGGGGRSLARATAAVPGPGREIAESALRERRAGAEDRILQTLRRDLGEPGDYHATLTALDNQRLNDADPLYREAFDQPAQNSPTLEAIEHRPSIEAARKQAMKLARERGQDIEELGLGRVENAGAWDSFEPPPFSATDIAPDVGFVPRRRPRGPARAPSRGVDMLEAISRDGGLVDRGGDFHAMGAGGWHVGKPGRSSLIGDPARADMVGGARAPVDPDIARIRMWERGYFPEQPEEPPTLEAFREAIREGLAGRRRYARAPDEGAQSRFDAGQAADEMDYYGGDPSDLPTEESYVGRPAPYYEPANELQLSWQGWDWIKQALDDQIRPYDEGKLTKDNWYRSLVATSNELRGELDRLNPAYGRARAAYAGPSELMDAAAAGRGLLRRRQDAETIGEDVGNMSRAARDAFALGLSRDLADRFRSNHPSVFAKQFRRDGVLQDRIRAAFGDGPFYDQFMGDVMDEARRQDVYDSILSGSRTTPLREDIDAANLAGEGLGETAREVIGRRAQGYSLRRQAVDAVANAIARSRTPALNDPAVSQILGEVLYKGRDPREVLAAAQAQQLVTPDQADELASIFARAMGAAGDQVNDAPALEVDVSQSTNPEHLAWRQANGLR